MLSLEGGKRKSFYGRTRAEVADKLHAALREQAQGLPIAQEKQTVEQFLVHWLDTLPELAPSTLARYRGLVTHDLIPAIGRIALGKLTAQRVQSLYAAKREQGLSETTVRHLHMFLHRALGSAVRLGLVARNVTELVDVPRLHRSEMHTLSPDEAKQLVDTAHAHGDRLEALYVLALTTGMRQGELLGLRWRDVDVEANAVRVVTSLQWRGNQYVLREPKTRGSRRQVALPAAAVTALRAHRVRQNSERLKAGRAWHDLDLVFPNQVGNPLRRNNLLHLSFGPLLRRAGLTHLRFHDLRHTAATLLLRSGVHPKVVSEMLGHASVSITLDTYSHVLPDMQRDATAAMDRLFGSS